ncbi:MAG: efflux RND transporter periplasmic adaptor subunit [Pseudomonadota bacterium]|nr:efflux RND transporter periplasmic adaptor subunit [Pseudomonadota bacterium]
MSFAFSAAGSGRALRPVLAALALAAAMTGAHAQPAPDPIAISQAARLALGIETVAAERATRHDGVALTGHMVVPPELRQAVVAPAAMIVADTLVLPGQHVSAGDPVQRLYSPALASLHAELDVLRLEAAHTAELAERAEVLLDAGLTTGEDVHERRLAAIAARLELGAMESRFGDFSGESDPARFLALSPADGVVAEIATEAGTRLGEGDVIVSVTSGNAMWARVHVPENLSTALAEGAPVRVPGVSGSGQVVAIDSMIDPARRAVAVHVALPEGVPGRPGALVDLLFPTAANAEGLSLPARAVVRLDGEEHVFVDRGAAFQAVPVTVLTRTRDRVTVGTAPLAEGDRVAVSGLAALKNMAEGG